VELKLPISVIGQVDVVRLLRELNALNDFFINALARKSGTSMTPPRITRALDELAKVNQFNLLELDQRSKLEVLLKSILSEAPLLHISFAAEPSPRALERILSWLRQNIHAQTLLQVGLQPTIAAGCVLRTPNRLIDMSMRNYLKQQEPYLRQLIQGATSERR
jgi:F0F1-type ATP synthase delta subunit